MLALALGFGRPALLPSASGSAPLVAGTDAGVLYDAAEPGALTEAVRACLDLDLPRAFAASTRLPALLLARRGRERREHQRGDDE